MTQNDTLVSFTRVQKTYDGINVVVRNLNLDRLKCCVCCLALPSIESPTMLCY